MYLSTNKTIIDSTNSTSTLKNDQIESLFSNFTEHQDLFWPILIGFFVAFALGLMIYRSKFSIEESSEQIDSSSSMKSFQKKYFFCCWFIRKSENGSIEITRNSIIQRLSENENDPTRILNSNSSDIQSPMQRISQQLAAKFGFNQRSSVLSMMPLEKKSSLRRDSVLSVLENEFDQEKISETIFHATKMDFHSSTDHLKTNQFFF